MLCLQYGSTTLSVYDMRAIKLLFLLYLVSPLWTACQGQEGQSNYPKQNETSLSPFGSLVDELSGEPGYFDTDNLISNESSYLHAIGQLQDRSIQGGAYLGVGPDQNFSYIAHIQPQIAFIVDIRRDNMLLHLLYKAIFELSENRIEFLCNLFGRQLVSDDTESNGWEVTDLLEILDSKPRLPGKGNELSRQVAQKINQFGVNLSEDDMATIYRFHQIFMEKGPSLRFTSHNRGPRPYYPTYQQLMLEHDKNGEFANFLSREQHFRYLKEMHESDLIIPVVGNFSSPDAIPAVAEYLKGQGYTLSAFYTSNVEYYLMYQRQFTLFLDNIKQLPFDENSIVIRSYFNRYRTPHPETVPGYASTQLIQSITSMLKHPDASYVDLIFEHSLTH